LDIQFKHYCGTLTSFNSADGTFPPVRLEDR
jgi:hypothetical protein